MKFISYKEFEHNELDDNAYFFYLDCPAQRELDLPSNNLIFGIKDYFLANPKNDNVVIGFTKEELKYLKDIFNTMSTKAEESNE